MATKVHSPVREVTKDWVAGIWYDVQLRSMCTKGTSVNITGMVSYWLWSHYLIPQIIWHGKLGSDAKGMRDCIGRFRIIHQGRIMGNSVLKNSPIVPLE